MLQTGEAKDLQTHTGPADGWRAEEGPHHSRIATLTWWLRHDYVAECPCLGKHLLKQ